ncbi:transposase [Leisingera sp. ANG59]|uniref:IS66-like element accessory protein TnpA n=2 Tax=Leisingera sp. ANG59 TaxID=2675221 RepID=UPI0015746435|nr:transposase [Leisingera sp. ANG59]NSY39316.1 transposase [Leisingera sp. ANG59]
MAGKKGQKKRFWSDEEKRTICRQTRAPGVSVAQVARRYAMNSNLLFTWLRDPRFAPADHEISSNPGDGDLFLPVEITEFATEPDPRADLAGTSRSTDARVLAQRVDITLSDGRRVVVEGPTALSAVLGLVKGLMA